MPICPIVRRCDSQTKAKKRCRRCQSIAAAAVGGGALPQCWQHQRIHVAALAADAQRAQRAQSEARRQLSRDQHREDDDQRDRSARQHSRSAHERSATQRRHQREADDGEQQEAYEYEQRARQHAADEAQAAEDDDAALARAADALEQRYARQATAAAKLAAGRAQRREEEDQRELSARRHSRSGHARSATARHHQREADAYALDIQADEDGRGALSALQHVAEDRAARHAARQAARDAAAKVAAAAGKGKAPLVSQPPPPPPPSKPAHGHVVVVDIPCVTAGTFGCFLKPTELAWLNHIGRFMVEKITQPQAGPAQFTHLADLTPRWLAYMATQGVKILKPDTRRESWRKDIIGSAAAYAALSHKYTTLRPFASAFGFRLTCRGHTHKLRVAYHRHKKPVIMEVEELYLFPQLSCMLDLHALTFPMLVRADKTQPLLPNPHYVHDIRQFLPLFKEIGTCLQLALTALHKKGYAHCDLKPANVVFCASQPAGERIKLIDFGLMRHIAALTVEDIGTRCDGTTDFCTPYYKQSMNPHILTTAQNDLLLQVEETVRTALNAPPYDERHQRVLTALQQYRADWFAHHRAALYTLQHKGQPTLATERYQHYANDYYGVLCIMVGLLRERPVAAQLQLLPILEPWLATLHPPTTA